MTGHPNLFIIGAPRCGTTSLYIFLKQQKAVFMSEVKEPEFHATDVPFAHAVSDEVEYLRLFSNAENARWLGEASTFYLYSADAPKNIRACSPESKFIVSVRNPSSQIESYHRMLLSIFWEGSEDIPQLQRALDREEERSRGVGLPSNGTMPDLCYQYRTVASFAKHIKCYITEFGSENVHVVVFDDLKNNPERVQAEICRFLEIPFNKSTRITHNNRIGRPLNNSVFSVMRLFRGPLYSILGDGLGHLWKLNSTRKKKSSLSEQFLLSLDSEFKEEMHELSELLDRDLVTLWSDAGPRP